MIWHPVGKAPPTHVPCLLLLDVAGNPGAGLDEVYTVGWHDGARWVDVHSIAGVNPGPWLIAWATIDYPGSSGEPSPAGSAGSVHGEPIREPHGAGDTPTSVAQQGDPPGQIPPPETGADPATDVGLCPACHGVGNEIPWLTPAESPCPACSGTGVLAGVAPTATPHPSVAGEAHLDGPPAAHVARWLEPQPDPVGGGPSVTAWLFERLVLDESRDRLLAELLLTRRQQGVGRYGVELRAVNGRSARRDALQEAVDLWLYLGQEAMEDGRVRRRLAVVEMLVVELARDIWLEPRPGEVEP